MQWLCVWCVAHWHDSFQFPYEFYLVRGKVVTIAVYPSKLVKLECTKQGPEKRKDDGKVYLPRRFIVRIFNSIQIIGLHWMLSTDESGHFASERVPPRRKWNCNNNNDVCNFHQQHSSEMGILLIIKIVEIWRMLLATENVEGALCGFWRRVFLKWTKMKKTAHST